MIEESRYTILKEELESYIPALAKAGDAIIKEGVSSYPIFVVHQQTINIGIQIVDRNNVGKNWSVNSSTLEEFVQKKLISLDKVEAFKKVYRDPSKEICLFVLSELGASFVFLPRNK